MTIVVLRIPQVDRGVRMVAVSAADAEQVRDDPAMIDAITALGVMHVDADGTQVLGPVGPRWQDIPEDVLAALGWRG